MLLCLVNTHNVSIILSLSVRRGSRSRWCIGPYTFCTLYLYLISLSLAIVCPESIQHFGNILVLPLTEDQLAEPDSPILRVEGLQAGCLPSSRLLLAPLLDDLFQDSSAISVGTPDVPGLLSHARVRFEELRAVESKGGGGFREGC